MKKRVVVLDFDGTITDAEEEGKGFVAGYMEDLCLLVGKKIEEVQPVFLAAEAEIAANPDVNGWLYNGKIVAPATVDPYLRVQPVARKVFDHFHAFADSSDKERLINFLYTNNYPLSGTVFKDGAKQMLVDLCANDKLSVYIVTNSHTESVRKKIMALSDGDEKLVDLCKRVIGGAKKYVVEGYLIHHPESMGLEGLSRPIYLHRLAYYDVLNRLREENGVGWAEMAWEEMTVIGDIFELDLALPMVLGARIGLVANKFTPEYEKNFILKNSSFARIIRSLSEIVNFVS